MITALAAAVPLLLLALVLWVSLKVSEWRARREQAKAEHPAKGTLSLRESEEWLNLVEQLGAGESAEGHRG